MLRILLVLLCAAVALQSHAQVSSTVDKPALDRCAEIEDGYRRLECYDALTQRPQKASLIEERWAIGLAERDVRFDLRQHKPSYLLGARYSDEPNRTPSSPRYASSSTPQDIERSEAKFQVSFKVKFGEIAAIGADLWAGYTQQSHWQLYSSANSRPFRETNYEPELMLAFHPDRRWLGWRWRLLVLGINHQSNGRAEPLSRSWNRVYLQAGFERDNLAVLLRPWLRIREDAADDDNPDITKFFGYGDLVAVYRFGGQSFSVLGRYRPGTGKGAAQLNWTFPLQRRVRGYVQAFSGYGESLIDYNVRQNTIGIGVSLGDYL